MNKVKVILGSLAIISMLSLSGCLYDPFWWGDGPHHGGGHYERGGYGEGHGGGRGEGRGGW